MNLKPPSFQLNARDAQRLSYAALCSSKLIKATNFRRFTVLCVLPSLLSHLVRLSRTGVKYPNVREQSRSSLSAIWCGDSALGLPSLFPYLLRSHSRKHRELSTCQFASCLLVPPGNTSRPTINEIVLVKSCICSIRGMCRRVNRHC